VTHYPACDALSGIRFGDIESDYDPLNFAHIRDLCGKLLETLSCSADKP
jgi:hypothetical protein